MPSVDLDAPEHSLCSHALARAKEDWYASNRALHAAWKERDTALAEVARLRAALEDIAYRTKMDPTSTANHLARAALRTTSARGGSDA